MRFCLVSTQPNWGGGEALIWSIGHELQTLGHEVAWMARAGSELANRIAKAGEVILHLHSGKGLAPREWYATLAGLKQWSPDAIIANDTHAVHLAGTTSWFCANPKPVRIAYKHTIFPLRSKVKYQFLTDKIVCVSRAAQKVVVDGGVKSDRTEVIYGGCNPVAVPPNARQAVDREFDWGASVFLMVCVGNLLTCKGHLDLIRATAQLVATRSDFRLLIAGEGKERERLAASIEQYGVQKYVRLLGYRDDADRLLAAADLVVHPSISEGLSLVLIQAQMMCKPIVATAVGGTVEVLAADDPDACTAWLSRPGDADHLAHQIGLARDQLSNDGGPLAARRQQTAERTIATFDLRQNALRLVELVDRTRRHGKHVESA